MAALLSFLWTLDTALGVGCAAAAAKNIFASSVPLAERAESVILSLILFLVAASVVFTALVRMDPFFTSCRFTGRVWGRGLLLLAMGSMCMVIPTERDWALVVGALSFFLGVAYVVGAAVCGLCGSQWAGVHVARPFLGVVSDPDLAPPPQAPLRSAAAGAAKAAAFQGEPQAAVNPFTSA